jgi:c-di-GMP-binding flagellar brake protein YcgR
MGDGLEIGLRLQIKAAHSENDWYSSRVEDLTEETVTIGVPIKAGVLVPLPPGSQIDCQFPKDDAFYSFRSTIMQRRHQPLPVLILRRPVEVQRFQRRKLFRLPVVLPVSFAVEGREGGQKGTTLDLSGGGVGLVAGEQLAVGTGLEVRLSLPDGYHLVAKGRVVKSVEGQADKGQKRYVHGVEFEDLPLPVQERVVSFIFNAQRERRRREIGGW